MQEKMEACIATDDISNCICLMDEVTGNITVEMNSRHVERTVREGLKKAVCRTFKVCVELAADEGISMAECKTAAEQVIDEASCVKEGKQHLLRRCMMHDLKTIQECSLAEAGDCFKDSLELLVKGGFKRRQGKRLVMAQAIKEAYESFDDCNCTDESASLADCHVIAKEAFNSIRRIDDAMQLDAQYNKTMAKVEELASVVCAGGETVLMLKDVLAVDFSSGDEVCANTTDASEMTDRVAAEGFGAMKGTAECAVEFNKAWIKTKYPATNRTTVAINAVADKIVAHFTADKRRLTATYDEVYADQDSEEVNADSILESVLPAQSRDTDTAQAPVPVGMVCFALALVGHVM